MPETARRSRRQTPAEADCLVLNIWHIAALALQKGDGRSWELFHDGRWLAGGEFIVKNGEPTVLVVEFLPWRPDLNTVPLRQELAITTTSASAGARSRRRWFICPKTAARVATLYLPAGETEFRSMKGWNLAYETTLMSPIERIEARLDDLFSRLGASYDGIFHDPPQKPQRMRFETYWQILEEIDATELELMRLEQGPEMLERKRAAKPRSAALERQRANISRFGSKILGRGERFSVLKSRVRCQF